VKKTGRKICETSLSSTLKKNQEQRSADAQLTVGLGLSAKKKMSTNKIRRSIDGRN
jgi:hypothetical protein